MGEEVSGALRVKGSEKDIFINKYDGSTRRRFTIAHELGHYFLHHDPSVSPDETIVSLRSARTKKESEADLFAAELLMPKDHVLSIYEKLNPPFLSDIAKHFNVSKAAMAFRLDYLGKRGEYINL